MVETELYLFKPSDSKYEDLNAYGWQYIESIL